MCFKKTKSQGRNGNDLFKDTGPTSKQRTHPCYAKSISNKVALNGLLNIGDLLQSQCSNKDLVPAINVVLLSLHRNRNKMLGNKDRKNDIPNKRPCIIVILCDFAGPHDSLQPLNKTLML